MHNGKVTTTVFAHSMFKRKPDISGGHAVSGKQQFYDIKIIVPSASALRFLCMWVCTRTRVYLYVRVVCLCVYVSNKETNSYLIKSEQISFEVGFIIIQINYHN